MIAAQSLAAAVVSGAYLAVTLTAAMRTEEATLEARFGAEYFAYRDRRTALACRPFSIARAFANREHRAVAGFVAAAVLLYLRAWL